MFYFRRVIILIALEEITRCGKLIRVKSNGIGRCILLVEFDFVTVIWAKVRFQ